jgi:hypothetical protein
MKEVTKSEFYSFIGPRDLKCSVVGDYPYTCLWKDRYGNLYAKSVESYPSEGTYQLVTTYFIKL